MRVTRSNTACRYLRSCCASSTFGYTGEQTGPSGDLYLRARTYDPETGRFLSADTVQPNAPGTQGYNRYAYVANNPTTWTDPSGHDAVALPAAPPLIWQQWVLSAQWLTIGIALGGRYVALACALNPLICVTTLGAIAIGVIIVFAIIACVLEYAGPCWRLATDETKTDTPTGTDTGRRTDSKPSSAPDAFPPPVRVPTPDREDDDPCAARKNRAYSDPIRWRGHILQRHGPHASPNQRPANGQFTLLSEEEIGAYVADMLMDPAVKGEEQLNGGCKYEKTYLKRSILIHAIEPLTLFV